MCLQFYEFSRLEYLETAIWPLLYLHEKWCESNISGQVYVLSFQVKHSFVSCSNTPKNIKVTYNLPNRNIISSQESRLSSKLMFRAKLHSEIIDFSNNFQLLQFTFDHWLYKMVSGRHSIFITTKHISYSHIHVL